MELSNKQELEGLPKDLLIREANVIFHKIKEYHQNLILIKEVTDSRGGYEEVDDMVERSDREKLKKAIYLMVELDKLIEEIAPHYRSSSDFILEVDDFFKGIEWDNELVELL